MRIAMAPLLVMLKRNPASLFGVIKISIPDKVIQTHENFIHVAKISSLRKQVAREKRNTGSEKYVRKTKANEYTILFNKNPQNLYV